VASLNPNHNTNHHRDTYSDPNHNTNRNRNTHSDSNAPRYISDPKNLKCMMEMLRDKSKNIQFEAFHVFKVIHSHIAGGGGGRGRPPPPPPPAPHTPTHTHTHTHTHALPSHTSLAM
jgi:hypothetical protein